MIVGSIPARSPYPAGHLWPQVGEFAAWGSRQLYPTRPAGFFTPRTTTTNMPEPISDTLKRKIALAWRKPGASCRSVARDTGAGEGTVRKYRPADLAHDEP